MAPLKVRPGKASTVNVACWPTCTRPTSASSTLVSTCILLRSCAMTKSTGAWRLAAEVALAVHHRHLRLERLGVGRREGGARALLIGPRLFDDRLLVEDHGLRPVELGLGLVDLRLEEIGVDAGDDLPLAHRGVEVDEHLLDLPRDLRADLHGDDGVESAGGRDGGGERSPRHRHRAVHVAAGEGAGVEIAAPAHRDQTEYA